VHGHQKPQGIFLIDKRKLVYLGKHRERNSVGLKNVCSKIKVNFEAKGQKMILYNVTVAIDKKVEKEWVKWMKDIHIPEVLATNQFLDHKFFKVLNTDDPESSSYSIQYFAEHMNNVQMYLSMFAPELQQKHHLQFPNQFAAFRTLLETV
tara:strand:- start:44241 stop:44690 length:450 start_codon:yes stop_codon:yes gene_type:complete